VKDTELAIRLLSDRTVSGCGNGYKNCCWG